MLDRFNENEIDFDVYLEAKSIDPEVNKKRILAKLKYNPINKTIESKVSMANHTDAESHSHQMIC